MTSQGAGPPTSLTILVLLFLPLAPRLSAHFCNVRISPGISSNAILAINYSTRLDSTLVVFMEKVYLVRERGRTIYDGLVNLQVSDFGKSFSKRISDVRVFSGDDT